MTFPHLIAALVVFGVVMYFLRAYIAAPVQQIIFALVALGVAFWVCRYFRILSLAFLCSVGLASCAGKVVTLADGTKVTSGHLGGKDFFQYKRTAAGAITFTSRSDAESSFRDGAQAVVAGVGLYQAGLSNRATTAADAVVAQGAQKAGVAGQKIAADVDMARIAADVEKHNGPILPATPTP